MTIVNSGIVTALLLGWTAGTPFGTDGISGTVCQIAMVGTATLSPVVKRKLEQAHALAMLMFGPYAAAYLALMSGCSAIVRELITFKVLGSVAGTGSLCGCCLLCLRDPTPPVPTHPEPVPLPVPSRACVGLQLWHADANQLGLVVIVLVTRAERTQFARDVAAWLGLLEASRKGETVGWQDEPPEADLWQWRWALHQVQQSLENTSELFAVGTVLMFDLRVFHRGPLHKSGDPRFSVFMVFVAANLISEAVPLEFQEFLFGMVYHLFTDTTSQRYVAALTQSGFPVQGHIAEKADRWS